MEKFILLINIQGGIKMNNTGKKLIAGLSAFSLITEFNSNFCNGGNHSCSFTKDTSWWTG